jgi:putative NADPH-quinone reductase
MKNIVVINGHPDNKSFCHALARAYISGAKHAAKYSFINLPDLKFDPILHFGYRKKMPLEPDLISAQEMIKAADHVVFVFPNWWGTYPALLKGFIDRMWLPGFGYKFIDGKLLPQKLLKGKTGRLIITMNTPSFIYKLILKQPGVHGMRDSVMKFSGISKVRTTMFWPIENKSPGYYKKILDKVECLGKYDANK